LLLPLTLSSLFLRYFVNPLLDFLASLEKGESFARDLSQFSRLWVSPGVALVLLDVETTQTSDLDSIAAFVNPVSVFNFSTRSALFTSVLLDVSSYQPDTRAMGKCKGILIR
jgi:hypothetical protein